MSKKTSDDATLQMTKQMLDELDALMEKMLALPVKDPEEAGRLPEEVIEPPKMAPTLAATLTLLDSPAPASESETTRDDSHVSAPGPAPAHPPLNAPHFAPVSGMPQHAPTVREPAPQPEPLTNQVIPPSTHRDLQSLLEKIPEPETPIATFWVYRPLLWINQGFDQATTILGPVGALLRSQAFRALLGLSGIALMAGAIVWLLKDALGWK
jgi:hypothetical protein